MSESEKSPTGAEPRAASLGADVSRRDFLSEVGFAALGIAGLGAAVVTYRYLSPNVLFGFHAVSAVCTHLGCITQWKPEAEQIACPCHGSKFRADGTKIEGPAPLSLPHFSITLTADGELRVDKLETAKPTQALRV